MEPRIILVRAHPFFRASIAAGLTALATASHAADSKEPTFKATVSSQENTPYALAVTTDKKVLSLDFGRLTANLYGRVDLPTIAARTFSIVLPVSDAEMGIKIAVFVQGFWEREAGVDGSLITVANGRAHPMDFAGMDPSKDGVLASTECADLEVQLPKRRIRKERPVSTGNYFLQCFRLELPSAQDLRLSMFLLLNRRDRDNEALLQVANIDAVILSDDVPPTK